MGSTSSSPIRTPASTLRATISKARRQNCGEESRGRLGGCASMATAGRRLRHGQRGRSAALRRDGAQGLPASASKCASSASAKAAWSASTPLQASMIGPRIRSAIPATIANTFRQASDVAEDHGERLAAEGEICWGGMHSWRAMVDLLQQVDRPKTLGFQADMAHTLLYTLGYNAPEDAHPAGRIRLGPERGPRRGVEDAHRRAAALDRSISTSLKMMRR